MVGPFARASNLPYDVRILRATAPTAILADFASHHGHRGRLLRPREGALCWRCSSPSRSSRSSVAKIPAGDIEVGGEGRALPTAPRPSNVLEQPRGECYYYARGNGSKNLERMRMRTPTSQNLAGMTVALKGCDLADVNMIVLDHRPLHQLHGKVGGYGKLQSWAA